MAGYFIDCGAEHVESVVRCLNNAKAESIRIAYSEDDTEACIMYIVSNNELLRKSIERQEEFVSTMAEQFQIEDISVEVFDVASEERKQLFRSSVVVYDKGLPCSGGSTEHADTEDESEDEEDETVKPKVVECPKCGEESTPEKVRFSISIEYSETRHYSGNTDIEDGDFEIDKDGDWIIRIGDYEELCEEDDSEYNSGPDAHVTCLSCGHTGSDSAFGIYEINFD